MFFTNQDKNILFLVACDFMDLDRIQKLSIGIDLRILDYYDTRLTEDEIEEKVLSGAVANKQIVSLTELVNKVKYE